MKKNAPDWNSNMGLYFVASRCFHCGTQHGLQYFKESTGANDLYYCTACFGLYEWNGLHMEAIKGEAYPNRDKSKDMAFKTSHV